MRLEIPKVVVLVDLGEYAPELKGQAFYVWANPTLDILRKHNELVKENDGDGLCINFLTILNRYCITINLIYRWININGLLDWYTLYWIHCNILIRRLVIYNWYILYWNLWFNNRLLLLGLLRR